MIDPWYCKECKVMHDRHVTKPVYIDFTGACISADDWRDSHYDEEEMEERSIQAWIDHVDNLDDMRDIPLFKTLHNCGHVTEEVIAQPMAWCRDCRDRRMGERYEY